MEQVYSFPHLHLRSKQSTHEYKRRRRGGFYLWVGEIPWRRKWQPTPVFWPGEIHGQRSLVGSSPWGLKESDTTEYAGKGCTAGGPSPSPRAAWDGLHGSSAQSTGHAQGHVSAHDTQSLLGCTLSQSWDLPPCRHLTGQRLWGRTRSFVSCTCHAFCLFLEGVVKQDSCDLIS